MQQRYFMGEPIWEIPKEAWISEKYWSLARDPKTGELLPKFGGPPLHPKSPLRRPWSQLSRKRKALAWAIEILTLGHRPRRYPQAELRGHAAGRR